MINFWRKRIPTLFALLLLSGGLMGGIFLVQRGSDWFLKAESGILPQKVRLTNITESSFTVSWVTETKTQGFVRYGLGTHEATAFDERDESAGETAFYSTHHVKISQLQPSTKYYFKIGSGAKLFDKNGQPYEATTAPSLGSSPPADTAHGSVLKSDGTPAAGAIVYLTLDNAAPLSDVVSADGHWAIPLSMARTSNLADYLNYDAQTTLEEILAQGGEWGQSTAIVTTKDDSPVPPLTLGQSYDFREADQVKSPSMDSEKSRFSLEPLASPPPLKTENLTITSPENDEELATQKPEIQGIGPANQEITITLESPEPLTTTITIGQDGRWHWTPPTNLLPGRHQVVVALGDGRFASHSFVVLAAENDLPVFTSTPSGEMSPTPTATTRPTVTPTLLPGITATPIPTSTPTLRPTMTPRPTPTLKPTLPPEEIPEAAYLTPTFLLVILGLILTLTGLTWGYQENLHG